MVPAYKEKSLPGCFLGGSFKEMAITEKFLFR
jgi:hypothetical protein